MDTLLITGGGGFLGGAMVRAGLDAGLAVTAAGRGPRPAGVPAGVEWVQGDLSRPGEAAPLRREWWGVIHLAAESVPARYDSAATVLDSLALLLNLTEALPAGRLLYVSSCHVYGPGPAPKRETMGAAPSGPYGMAKAMGEVATLAQAHLDVRIARPFNSIGPGMRPNLLLPTLLKQIARAGEDEPVVLLGRDSVRDFLDVRDICAAYLAILRLEQPAERVFNVCSGVPTSIRTLAETLIHIAGRRNPVEFLDRVTSEDDVNVLVGVPSRIARSTGWSAQIPLSESLAGLLTALA